MDEPDSRCHLVDRHIRGSRSDRGTHSPAASADFVRGQFLHHGQEERSRSTGQKRDGYLLGSYPAKKPAELQPGHELQVDTRRQPREQRRPIAQLAWSGTDDSPEARRRDNEHLEAAAADFAAEKAERMLARAARASATTAGASARRRSSRPSPRPSASRRPTSCRSLSRHLRRSGSVRSLSARRPHQRPTWTPTSHARRRGWTASPRLWQTRPTSVPSWPTCARRTPGWGNSGTDGQNSPRRGQRRR